MNSSPSLSSLVRSAGGSMSGPYSLKNDTRTLREIAEETPYPARIQDASWLELQEILYSIVSMSIFTLAERASFFWDLTPLEAAEYLNNFKSAKLAA